jgi:hypothetical protein
MILDMASRSCLRARESCSLWDMNVEGNINLLPLIVPHDDGWTNAHTVCLLDMFEKHGQLFGNRRQVLSAMLGLQLRESAYFTCLFLTLPPKLSTC